MQVLLYSLLLLVNTLEIASANPYPALPRITPAPGAVHWGVELRRRDIILSTVSNYASVISDDHFIGWFDAGASTTRGITCGSDSSGNYQTWTTIGNLGGCCWPGQFCDQVLSCSSGYLIYSSGTPWQCPTSNGYFQCGTMTVYASTGAPPISSVDCFVDNYSAWTLIHDVSAVATSSSTQTTSISGSQTTTVPPATSTGTSASTPQPGSSKSTVIGGVLGALLGISLVAVIGVFVFFRRQQKHEIEKLKSSWGAHASPTPMVYYSQHAQLEPAELPHHR